MVTDKINILKRKLIKLGVVNLVVVVVCLAVTYWSSAAKDSAIQHNTKLADEISALQVKKSALENKIQDLKAAAKLWDTLNIKNKKREGLQIDTAKSLLKQYEKHYYLSAPVTVSLSTPTELSDVYKTPSTVVIASEVSLKLSGLKDSYLLEFVDALFKNLPGFAKVKSFAIERNGVITNEVLSRVAQGELPSLVSIDLVFSWRDFKDISKSIKDTDKPKK
jgi:cell division protein FtsL